MKHWMKWMSALLTLAMLLGCGALAEEAPEEAPEAAIEASVEAVEASTQDNLVVTEHTATFGDKTVNYTATAGTMVMDTALGQYEIFFTAYTARDVEDVAKRPITFTFNGGPGAASLWLHMGLLGPERIGVNPEGMLEDIQVGHNPNPYSILDLTDLVFIDPVGTGYSRALPGTDETVFYDTYNDYASVGDFIRLYVSRNDRWASPKYLAGESYGTTRAVGVCNYLMNAWHMNMNGLMLISSANDYAAMSFATGNEVPYVNFFPTYAAAAWYHGLVGDQYKNLALEAFLDEARAFAASDYLSALYQGTRLTDAQRDDIAQRMSEFIGLSKDFILRHDLRVPMEEFCSELMGDQKLMVGRLDSRYTAPIVPGNIGTASNDPSAMGILEAFTAVYSDYVSRELNYKTDREYESLSGNVISQWSFDSDNRFLSQEETIRTCMSANKFLKVWVLCGYYDLATPFFGAEWIFSHIFLNPEEAGNVSFTYYPAGHMFYMVEDCVEKFHGEAAAWYGAE